LDTSGIDLYDAGGINAKHVITLTTTCTTGLHVFKLKINGKNANSSNYGIAIYGVMLQ
jgi:hypothetical protein